MKQLLVLLSSVLLLTGCEEEHVSTEEKREYAKEQYGSVSIDMGDNGSVAKVDTVGAPVDIKAGDNADIGPINTGSESVCPDHAVPFEACKEYH